MSQVHCISPGISGIEDLHSVRRIILVLRL